MCDRGAPVGDENPSQIEHYRNFLLSGGRTRLSGCSTDYRFGQIMIEG